MAERPGGVAVARQGVWRGGLAVWWSGGAEVGRCRVARSGIVHAHIGGRAVGWASALI